MSVDLETFVLNALFTLIVLGCGVMMLGMALSRERLVKVGVGAAMFALWSIAMLGLRTMWLS